MTSNEVHFVSLADNFTVTVLVRILFFLSRRNIAIIELVYKSNVKCSED